MRNEAIRLVEDRHVRTNRYVRFQAIRGYSSNISMDNVASFSSFTFRTQADASSRLNERARDVVIFLLLICFKLFLNKTLRFGGKDQIIPRTFVFSGKLEEGLAKRSGRIGEYTGQ